LSRNREKPQENSNKVIGTINTIVGGFVGVNCLGFGRKSHFQSINSISLLLPPSLPFMIEILLA